MSLWKHVVGHNVSYQAVCPLTRCRAGQLTARAPCKIKRQLLPACIVRPQQRLCSRHRSCVNTQAFAAADSRPPVSVAGKEQKRRRHPVLDSAHIWRLVKAQRAAIAVGSLCAVLCTLSNLASPVIAGLLLECLAGRQPMSLYPKLLGALAVMYTLEPLLSRVYIARAVAAAEAVLLAVRREAFATLLMQKIEFFDRRSASDLSSVITLDLDTLRTFVLSNVTRDRGLRAIMESVGSVVVLFILSWQLAPVFAAVMIGTALAAALYRRRTKKVEAANAGAVSAMNSIASEAFRNIRTVRSFAGEVCEQQRFEEHSLKAHDSGMRFGAAKGWLEASNRGAIHASLIVLYSLGGWLIATDRMPLRVLLSGIGFTYSLIYSTQGVANTLSDFRRASAALARVQSIVNVSEPAMEGLSCPLQLPTSSMNGHTTSHARRHRQPGQRALDTHDSVSSIAHHDGTVAAGNGSGAVDGVTSAAAHALQQHSDATVSGSAAVAAAQSGNLELRHVYFAYPMRPHLPVLRGLDLTMEKGTITALVGQSGAGKSTIAALLSRFYDVDGGSVCVGGHNITDFSRQDWASAVAMVSQEPVLFTGSIADNITYGTYRRWTQDEMVAAAKMANAHEFIEKLPQGYKTLVGSGGSLLSGGQRQRVAIARALMKNAPILILDEATSALDAASEKLVQGAIDRLVQGRTVLVIAHRLSTIQRADKIVVLKDGVVAEQGTHAQLIQQAGMYLNLVETQSIALTTI